MDVSGREIDALPNRSCVRGIIYLLRRTPTLGLLRNLRSGTRPAQQFAASQAQRTVNTPQHAVAIANECSRGAELATGRSERKITTSTFTRTPLVAEIADRTGYDVRYKQTIKSVSVTSLRTAGMHDSI